MPITCDDGRTTLHAPDKLAARTAAIPGWVYDYEDQLAAEVGDVTCPECGELVPEEDAGERCPGCGCDVDAAGGGA